MPHQNLGVCSSCRRIVPVRHVVRDGKVYLAKSCPDCGATEALVSTDAGVWQRKRDLWRYEGSAGFPCGLGCTGCGHDHKPAMVFVDVTNRCNMNCPICIANVPAMGFRFDPPLSYFDRLFGELAKLDPSPRINLFGGEPTMREDLFEIIELARSHGLRPRIVTNGVKLADEDYCRRIAEANVPVLFALDGLTEDVYARLRKNPGVLQTKLRALENLRRFSSRKHTIMCCAARKINEHQMGDLLAFCHENRSFIKGMHMIPLTETWEEGEFEADVSTTIEDVERMVAAAIPDEEAEFWSAGMPARLEPVLRFFGDVKITFGGVHPNCESMTLFFSDGERFRPARAFTTRSINEFLAEVVDAALEIEPFLSRLDPRRPAQRALGILRIAGAIGPKLRGLVDWRKVARGRPLTAVPRILLALARGRSLGDALRANTVLSDILHMIVLPFEEYHSVESERLCRCKAAFGYVDPETDEVGLVPVCAWSLYQRTIVRSIAEKYGGVPEKADAAATR